MTKLIKGSQRNVNYSFSFGSFDVLKSTNEMTKNFGPFKLVAQPANLECLNDVRRNGNKSNIKRQQTISVFFFFFRFFVVSIMDTKTFIHC